MKLHIHIHDHKRRRDNAFKESEHPRGQGGEFTSGGGGSNKTISNFEDLGKVNKKEPGEGETKITDIPFPGDTKVMSILRAAEKHDPDWKYGISDPVVKTIPKDKIVAMQPFVNLEHADKYGAKGGEKEPLAIEHEGKFYIYNGTHRVIGALRAGESHVKMRTVQTSKSV